MLLLTNLLLYLTQVNHHLGSILVIILPMYECASALKFWRAKYGKVTIILWFNKYVLIIFIFNSV